VANTLVSTVCDWCRDDGSSFFCHCFRIHIPRDALVRLSWLSEHILQTVPRHVSVRIPSRPCTRDAHECHASNVPRAKPTQVPFMSVLGFGISILGMVISTILFSLLIISILPYVESNVLHVLYVRLRPFEVYYLTLLALAYFVCAIIDLNAQYTQPEWHKQHDPTEYLASTILGLMGWLISTGLRVEIDMIWSTSSIEIVVDCCCCW
jgi:hypothetical protein